MIQNENKANCCGCTACASVCPKKCIQMVKDSEGFAYPKVDILQCINCGLCEKVCPMKSHETDAFALKAVAVQHKEENTLYHSAAGGAFSAIAACTIAKGGIAFGVAYDEKMVVYHDSAETIDELAKFRSSKYVQSDMRDAFLRVKQALDSGREVCFSGTPCQVAGLKNFLRKPYDNLITVDLVCKGVGSPAVLACYVNDMEATFNSKIVGMNFKRKTYGYHSSTMSVDFENGETYSKGGITDPMMRSFRANICLRQSCANCQFKGEHRSSDLTIFDCWHYKELTGKADNDKGHTAVLIHSTKGQRRIQECEAMLHIEEIDPEKVISLDGIMVRNRMEAHEKRQVFFDVLSRSGLNEAIAATIPISIGDRAKEMSKSLLYKLHLLSLVKRLNRK